MTTFEEQLIGNVIKKKEKKIKIYLVCFAVFYYIQ